MSALAWNDFGDELIVARKAPEADSDFRIEYDARKNATAIHLLGDTAMLMKVGEVHRLAANNDLTFNALNCARAYLGTIDWHRDPVTHTWWWVEKSEDGRTTLGRDLYEL